MNNVLLRSSSVLPHLASPPPTLFQPYWPLISFQNPPSAWRPQCLSTSSSLCLEHSCCFRSQLKYNFSGDPSPQSKLNTPLFQQPVLYVLRMDHDCNKSMIGVSICYCQTSSLDSELPEHKHRVHRYLSLAPSSAPGTQKAPSSDGGVHGPDGRTDRWMGG